MSSLILLRSALRRHPFSLGCTALLAALSAALVGAPGPSVGLVCLFWLAASLLGLEAWSRLEPFVVQRLGCRPPSRLERERLAPLLSSPPAEPLAARLSSSGADRRAGRASASRVELLVLDSPQPWIGRGLRSIVVSRAMLEVLDDRALIGLLTQTASPVWSGCVAGELVVWLGNLPLLCAWLVSRGIALIGRPLAVVVGASLVLPLLLCPFGFTRWVGRLLGAMLVGLFGTALVSAGLAGAGLGLLLSWAAVPAVRALLAWEGRRTERTADQATIEAGLGSQLLEALETLTWAEPVPGPAGVLRLLNRSGAPLACRAEIVFRSVSQS